MAADFDESKCIADAAVRVPTSALVKVTGATARKMTPIEASEYPSGPAMWVDVEASVSGKPTTYHYVCALTRVGRMVRLRE
jgi:hypothetical protein